MYCWSGVYPLPVGGVGFERVALVGYIETFAIWVGVPRVGPLGGLWESQVLADAYTACACRGVMFALGWLDVSYGCWFVSLLVCLWPGLLAV